MNGSIFQNFPKLENFQKNWVTLVKIRLKIRLIGIWMGHFFSENWYMDGGTLKFPAVRPYQNQTWVTPPPRVFHFSSSRKHVCKRTVSLFLSLECSQQPDMKRDIYTLTRSYAPYIVNVFTFSCLFCLSLFFLSFSFFFFFFFFYRKYIARGYKLFSKISICTRASFLLCPKRSKILMTFFYIPTLMTLMYRNKY